MIVDIPGPFSETSKGLTKEGFLSKGIEAKEIQNMTLNDLPAILVVGEQNAYGNVYSKYVLAFGTDKETILINGACPKNLENIGKLVKASILSAFYEADKVIGLDEPYKDALGEFFRSDQGRLQFFRIGGMGYSATAFRGVMDEVRLYGTPLSPEAIRDLYSR